MRVRLIIAIGSLIFLVGLQGLAQSTLYEVSALRGPKGFELSNQETVAFRSPVLPGMKIHFVDKLPGANWSHPAEFQLLSADGKIVETLPVLYPPRGLEKSHQLEAPLDAFDGDPVPAFSLNNFGNRYHVRRPENFYAILLNGFAEQRHWNDFSFIYRTLTDLYGYSKENIFVADTEHRNSQSDLNGDGSPDIFYDSSIVGLQKLFAEIGQKITAKDQLLVVVNTHGAKEQDGSRLVLVDGEITATEFSAWLRKLAAKNILAIFEQCFSGGFVRPTVDVRTVALAAATDKEFSWASMDLRFNEFLYLVTAAFAFQSHDGKSLSADVNQDGFVSLQEAFGFAVLRERRRESPLFESSPNSGLAAKLGFGEPPAP